MTFDEIKKRYKELSAQIAEIRTQSKDGVDLMSATTLKGATQEERSTELNTLLDEYEQLEPEFRKGERNNERMTRAAAQHGELAKPQNRLGTPVTENPLPVKVRGQKVRNFKGEGAELRAYAFGKYLQASLMEGLNPRLAQQAQEWCREHGFEMRTMTEGSNTVGGFLVPDQIENDMIDLREQYGVSRKYAKRYTMTGDTLSINRRTGGLQVYAVGETAAATESAKNWDKVGLVAKDFAVLSSFSQNLSDDALINIADDLAGEMAYAFALWEDQCFFTADGTGTYNGIVGLVNKFKNLTATRANIAGAVVGSGNAWSELVLQDFLNVVGKTPLYARQNARWYCHATFYDTVMQRIILAAGGITAQDMLNGYQSPRFAGFPVEFVQVLPSAEANDDIPVFFGDLSKSSAFGDRKQTAIDLDKSLGFKERIVWVQGFERFDINHHDIGNQSATAGLRVPGPVIALFSAAS